MEPLTATTTQWTFTQKILLRFTFCFIILWIIPLSPYYIPFLNNLESVMPSVVKGYNNIWGFFSQFWQRLADWVSSDMLHLKEPIFKGPVGSEETRVLLMTLSQMFLASLASFIWSILDRKRPSYNNLYYWTRVIMRYYLGYVMLGYGLSKIFHLQMSFPRLFQLTKPFGEQYPQELAWSFMGYSPAFSFYTGLGEVIGGILLFWRRTTSLGSLILIPVLSTVVMMNLAYDIPVKTHSLIYLLFAIILLIPDIKKLMNVLVWNKPTMPSAYPPMIHSFRMKKIKWILKYAFIIVVLIYEIDMKIEGQKQYGDKRQLPPLYGIYNTEYVIRNQDTVALLQNDTTVWKEIIVDFRDWAFIKTMNDTLKFYNFKVDTATSTVTISAANNMLHKSVLKYKLDPPHLHLQGIYKGDSLEMRLRRYDERNFLLIR